MLQKGVMDRSEGLVVQIRQVDTADFRAQRTGDRLNINGRFGHGRFSCRDQLKSLPSGEEICHPKLALDGDEETCSVKNKVAASLNNVTKDSSKIRDRRCQKDRKSTRLNSSH